VHGIYTGKYELSSFSEEDLRNRCVYLGQLIERVQKKTDELSARLQKEASERLPV
jgi:hypothetical protein